MDKFYEVELEKDVYSVGFLTFLKSNSPKKLDRVVLKCMWTAAFQCLLVGLLFYNYAFEKIFGRPKFKGYFQEIFVGDPSLNLTRMVCAFLLHVSILPEIRSAKDMLSFAKKNIHSFSGQSFWYPMLFAFFKMFGGIFCFFANIFICVYSDNIVDVVKDFVAVEIIRHVDNIMLGTITADDGVENMRLYVSKEKMEKTDFQIWKEYISSDAVLTAENKELQKEIEQSKMGEETGEYYPALTMKQKWLLGIALFNYRICSVVYHVVYFYFAPFLVSFVVIYAGSMNRVVNAAT